MNREKNWLWFENTRRERRYTIVYLLYQVFEEKKKDILFFDSGSGVESSYENTISTHDNDLLSLIFRIFCGADFKISIDETMECIDDKQTESEDSCVQDTAGVRSMWLDVDGSE